MSFASGEAKTQLDVRYQTITGDYPYGPLNAAEDGLKLSGALFLVDQGEAAAGEVFVDGETRSATKDNGLAIVVEGSVEIPNNLRAGNFGGYEVTDPVTVYVDFTDS
ncbi:hypothetical protein [Spiribacter roseus]|uniref:hypothetical protein n=1 Tax=Spiribacter roseus TaxID=1855875 RepID=UPI00132FD1EC|nr:hypothetical protein [Spiribacter roseus]KAF0282894.1 hypothetical protein BA898_05145 [Spiribacter roseus]